jgi:hypothetical protein
MTHTVFIEVGPLQEIRYSGIPNVTLNLCRYWLQQPSEASRRQALRFTWHDFARRIDEAIARTAAENAGSHPS